MINAVQKQNELAMTSLSLDEESSKELYSSVRSGFVFYDLVDFDSIKVSNTSSSDVASKVRFLLVGLSKLEAINSIRGLHRSHQKRIESWISMIKNDKTISSSLINKLQECTTENGLDSVFDIYKKTSKVLKLLLDLIGKRDT